MNKKISTLIAGVALLSAMSASASVELVKGTNSFYQLSVGAANSGTVLVMDEDGKLSTVAVANATFQNSLWCVTVSQPNLGVNPTYEFVNKGTGRTLDLTMAGLKGQAASKANDKKGTAQIEVGGEIGNWAFSNNYAAPNGTIDEQLITSYFTTDSVVALHVAGDKVVAEKYSVKTLTADVVGNSTFSLIAPDARALNAFELNTKIGSQDKTTGVTLKFNKDYAGVDVKNPFSTETYLAEDVTGVDDYVYLYKKDTTDSKKEYLMVDTGYVNENGVKFLAFKWVNKKADGATDWAADTYAGQYQFRFQYNTAKDSITINVREARFKDTETYWKDIAAAVEHAADVDNIQSGEAELFVKLQDLVKGSTRLVTIGERAINTNITLGVPACAPIADDRTSVASGLYVIKNAAGKFLAMPIHGDSTVQWVSKEANVNVWDMPSFQWVVEKNRTGSAAVEAISPIKITNREFSTVVDLGAQLWNSKVTEIAGTDVKVAGFEAATSTIMADSLLGYKNLDSDSLTVTTYKLKYWTAFGSEDLYMGATKVNDSVIYIGAKDNYVLAATGKLTAYGYKGTVTGLKPLYRQAYTMKSKAAGKMVVEGAESRFAISNSAAADTAKFFFKANNNVEGAIYYALVDTAYTLTPDSLRKVGVDENNKFLKAQVMTETRTSAFTVEVDNAPLYRRFDSEELEGNVGDAGDTLRFVEKYRKEYLQMEQNKSFVKEGIKFLGIDAAVKSKDGLSFTVDTAWVNRGLGYIKPQYLVSINKVAGTPKEVIIPCAQCLLDAAAGKPLPESCIHDTKIIVPGIDRGMFLVNFEDSVEFNANYAWGKYSRVGFVDALHIGDSLYLLIDQFAGLATEKIDVTAIQAADAKTATKGRYIKNLKFDDHKYYTWSFRYANPDMVNETEASREFLFESYPRVKADKIAPTKASWLKMQNGCLVMSDPEVSEFTSAKTGGDDALIFTIEKGTKEDIATENEGVKVSEVSVISSYGKVTITNAAGKKVSIVDMLGRVYVSETISSSEAIFNLPAKTNVIVAVEGEEAVKASTL